MKENLEIVRRLYHLMLGLSAAILIFAAATGPPDEYKPALDELQALKRISLEHYAMFIKQRVIAIDNSERVDAYKAFFKDVTGAEVAKDFVVEPLLYHKWPQSHSTLEEHRQFFEEENVIRWMTINTTDDRTRSFLSKRFSEVPLPPNTVIAKVFFLAPKEYVYEGEIANDEITWCLLKAIPPLTDFTFTATMVVVSTSSRSNTSQGRGLSLDDVPLTHHASTGSKYASQWLDTTGVVRSLKIPGHQGLFGQLKVYWNNVASMNAGQAANFLQTKIDSSKREVSILGLSVDTRLIVWVAPSSMMLMFIYLFVHLLHCRGIRGPTSEIATFPWVCLFSDTVSKIFSVFTIVVIPVSSIIAMLWRLNVATVLGSLLTLMLLLLTIAVYTQIRRLKAEEGGPSFAEFQEASSGQTL